MDYGKAFTFMFEDEDWLMKMILGGVFGLLSIILIGLPFVMGYYLQVVREVAEGRGDRLPAWDDLGDKFVQGLIYLIITFVFAIPMVLVGCANSFIAPALDNTYNSGGQALLVIIMVVIWAFFALYALLYSIVIPAITIRYAVTRDFGAAFNFSALWQLIKANIGNYILVLIITYAVSSISGIGIIACLIGVFLTMFWAYLVQAHLYGQYYRNFMAPSDYSAETEIAPPVL